MNKDLTIIINQRYFSLTYPEFSDECRYINILKFIEKRYKVIAIFNRAIYRLRINEKK